MKTETLKTIRKLTYLVGFGLLVCTTSAYAVPNDIPVMKTLLDKLIPYVAFAFTCGGVCYGGLNTKRVVGGDYRAIVPGVISIGVAGLGLAGIFGDDALTVLM